MRQNEVRRVEIGLARLDAVRTSYVGERQGWELVCTSDAAPHVYEELRRQGANDAGYFAIDSLRMERGRVAWGHELSPDETPFEAGLKFAVKIGKPGGFLGEAALRQLSPRMCLCLLSTEAGDLSALSERIIWGGEPVVLAGAYTRQHVTSASLCPVRDGDAVLVKNLAMAYLPITQAGDVAIEVAGQRVPVSVQKLPLRQ